MAKKKKAGSAPQRKRRPARERAPRKEFPKVTWTPEKYRDWVKGRPAEGMDSLREVMRGFDSRDGFNLNKYEDWSAKKKAKIRAAAKKVAALRAQPKIIVKPPKRANLKKLQDSFHGDVGGQFKVAYVPYHKPVVSLPGAKVRKPKITYLKRGIRIGNGIYDRTYIPFNQKALAKNAPAEITRAAKEMPGASLFYVAANENVTLVGRSLGILIPQVLQWMDQYDGRKAIPKGSGNYGDDPKKHHWRIWLNGLIGYHIPQRADRAALRKAISRGRAENRELKRKRRNLMRRKGR